MRRIDLAWVVCAAALTTAMGCGDSATATDTTGGQTTGSLTTTTDATTGAPTTGAPTTGTPTTGPGATDSGSSGSSSSGEPDPTTTGLTATTSEVCDVGQECGGECVDIETDPAHCGGCDMPCAGQCVAGVCEPACPEGQMDCGDGCVDLQSDPEHCGDCGTVCDPGEVCNMGDCAISCDMGLDVCDGACVDTQTDVMHCGGCDMPCEGCQMCDAGSCALPPAPAAPEAIVGDTKPCANATVPYSIPKVDGAVKYTWTVPNGAMVTMGQDTEMVLVKFAADSGQVCVTYNDGCVDSQPSCVDVTLAGGGMPGMQVFAYTGAPQEFTVPACVAAVTVELYGAQGGGAKCCDNSIQDDGGKGGYVKATLPATPGEKWGVYVGGKGATEGGAGWNGGGAGGQWGAGGGGGSDVRIGGMTLANRVLVAGGGGGGNCGCPEHGFGGAGGALVGDPGDAQGGGFTPGGGGTQMAGGAAGSNPGAMGQSGQGGGWTNSAYHIGAGGGGWFGGGGAYAAGGGGGSSYYGNAMNASTTKGLRSGDGEIRVSW